MSTRIVQDEDGLVENEDFSVKIFSDGEKFQVMMMFPVTKC